MLLGQKIEGGGSGRGVIEGWKVRHEPSHQAIFCGIIQEGVLETSSQQGLGSFSRIRGVAVMTSVVHLGVFDSSGERNCWGGNKHLDQFCSGRSLQYILTQLLMKLSTIQVSVCKKTIKARTYGQGGDDDSKALLGGQVTLIVIDVTIS